MNFKNLFIIFFSVFILSACTQRDPITEVVVYTISFQSDKVKGSVSESCYNYKSRPSLKCEENTNSVYEIDSYMCDLAGKLYVLNNSQTLLQEGVSCTRSFKKTPYQSSVKGSEKKYV